MFGNDIKVSPSILSADYTELGKEIEKVKVGGADMIHIDVMDGHFVPNITIGAPVVKKMREKTDIFFDCHLMISEPLKYIDDFKKAGADLISFHIESESDVKKTISAIKDAGILPAIALKPGTPAEAAFDYIKDVAMVLVMTVEPGFGGQSFMHDMLPKIKAVREKADKENPGLMIEVDGGIIPATAKLCVEAGADVLVSGSYVFSSENCRDAMESLR